MRNSRVSVNRKGDLAMDQKKERFNWRIVRMNEVDMVLTTLSDGTLYAHPVLMTTLEEWLNVVTTVDDIIVRDLMGMNNDKSEEVRSSFLGKAFSNCKTERV